MRTIQVSTDTYAAIWGARETGEESEDAILRRLLKIGRLVPSKPEAPREKKIGFADPRFGIELEEGFEIFRTYRGKEYRARATNGKWRLSETGAEYPSLNQLSRAIGTSIENAWQNWYFVGPGGKRQLVMALRK